MKYLFYLIFVTLLFTGCNKKDNTITIEFWTLQLSPYFDNYFNSIISEYEKQHPGVKIKWVDIPYDNAVQKLLSSVAAGSPPDIVNLSTDFIAKFAGMEALTDFNNLITKDTINSFLPNAIESCKYNNKLVGLPWYLNTYMVLYNKQLFNQAGLSEKDVPKSFDSLISLAYRYKNKTGKFLFMWNIGKESYLPMMLESEGLSMTNLSTDKAIFNSDNHLNILNKWVNLYRSNYIESESIFKTNAEIIESYQSGRSALVFTGPVFLKRIKDNAPSIYSNTEISTAITGKTGRHELAAMALSILQTSVNKKQAANFILFVLNSTNQIKFCKLATIFPSIKIALDDEYFKKGDGTLETKARIMGAKDLPNAVRLRKYLSHPQFDLLNDAFDQSIQEACLGKLSTKESINNAVLEWNKVFKESF